ncbi:MAG TPA: DUF3037 domain-containing protein [Terriglobales bacterium]|nr:DUF3037 domain-containing protein [Terriglobales bacterium]
MSACEFVLIRIAPDPIRNEADNIGVALYDPAAGGFAGVRISPDLRRLRQLSPLFEEGDLAGLEADLLARLQAPAAAEQFWRSREYFLQSAQESFSHAVQLSAPAVVLTADPAAELDRLYQQYAAPIVVPATAVVVSSARRAILRHLQRVFTEERVLQHLGRNVRAGEWLGEPDAFRFDYHYQPNGLHHALQAIPLASDETAIKELCFTVTRLRSRLGGLGSGLDVAGFDQPAAALSAPTADYHRGLLTDAGVRIMTLAEAPAEAARIRAALGIA